MAKDIWIFYKGTRFKRIQEDYLISEDEKKVMFNGYIYTWNSSKYFMGSGYAGKGIHTTLQRHVWEKHNGEIPDGYVIHHIDGNARNNSIENLSMLTKYEHGHLHATRPGSWSQSKACKEMLISQHEKAKEWHRSDEGRAWHKKHAENSLPSLRGITYKKTCAVCKVEYIAKCAWGKYCSNKCKTRQRVKSRVDDEKRICIICGKTFVCSRYISKKTCCKECASISTRFTKRGLRHNS